MGEKRRFLFVQSRDPLHILRGELEIEYLEVFFHPLSFDAFRDLLNPSDLVGERLLILQKGISGVLDAVRRYPENNYPGIMLTDSEKYYDRTSLWSVWITGAKCIRDLKTSPSTSIFRRRTV